MKHFFSMGRGEALMLAFLIAMAMISFLPMWRTIEIGGMAVFGWLLAALMILSPTLALLVTRRADRAKVEKIRHDATGFNDTQTESGSSGSETDPED